jgi:hypothetical protein
MARGHAVCAGECANEASKDHALSQSGQMGRNGSMSRSSGNGSSERSERNRNSARN